MSVPVGQRHVPDTPQNEMLQACKEAQDLAYHTIVICTNEKVFPLKYQTALTNDLIATAKNIYVDAWSANNIRVGDDPELWRLRSQLQSRAIWECDRLLAMIGLARKLYKLRGRKATYWSKKTQIVKGLLKKWHTSDVKRYKDVGERKDSSVPTEESTTLTNK